jgi:hypothetical protein
MSLQKDNDAMARLYTESVDESLLDKLSVDYPAEVEQLYHDAAAMETFRRFLMSGDYPDAADALMSAQPSDEPEPEHDRGLTGRSEDPRHNMENEEDAEFSAIKSYLVDMFEQEYGSNQIYFDDFKEDIGEAIDQKKEYDLTNEQDVLAQAIKAKMSMGLEIEEAKLSLKDDVLTGKFDENHLR